MGHSERARKKKRGDGIDLMVSELSLGVWRDCFVKQYVAGCTSGNICS
jgi:hypothetical protein